MPIGAGELSRLSLLLDQALALPPHERAEWLAALPQADRPHEGALRRMLAAQSGRADHLLGTMPRVPPEPDDTVAHAGDLVGAYRLERKLASGGMGSVWLAERVDGAMRRQVALKLPHLAWGDGLAERMARERDIGALLEHPHIARLYDAGLDPRGRPFLAFEYIDGVAIDTWCEKNDLALDERLRLFVQVARAVAYAHARLVIHRDLKPSNILVTGDGQAHLLDFGIAKLLNEGELAEGVVTTLLSHAMTPLYASPEQLTGATITVASDVYSLGVLLYVLLTGALPHEPKRQSITSFEEAILEGPPPKASERARSKVWSRALRGDIDAILAKSLLPAPSERYATVDALADDIERYLRGERVLARIEPRLHRLSRLVRRHWVGVSASIAVAASVLIGAGVAVTQSQRAAVASERERVIKAFLTDMFRLSGSINNGTKLERPVSAQSLLADGAGNIETIVNQRPELQADLYQIVGEIFFDMGAYGLSSEYFSLSSRAYAKLSGGSQQQAMTSLEAARALFEDRRINEAEDLLRKISPLLSMNSQLEIDYFILLAKIKINQGVTLEAVRLLDILESRLKSSGSPRSVSDAEALLARAELQSRLDDSVRLIFQAVKVARHNQQSKPAGSINVQLQAAIYLAETPYAESSDEYFESAVDALQKLGGANEIRAAFLTILFARSRVFSHHPYPFPKAIEMAERGLSRLKSTSLPIPDWFIPQGECWLALIKARAGEIAEAIRLQERCAPILWRRQLESGHLGTVAENAGYVAMLSGQHDLAANWFASQEDMHKRILGNEFKGPTASEVWFSAQNLMMQGRYSDALKWLDREGVSRFRKNLTYDRNEWNRYLMEVRAEIELATGRAAVAFEYLSKVQPDSDTRLEGRADFEAIYGEALCAIGRREEGMATLERTISYFIGKGESSNAPWIARLRAISGSCALALGDRSSAIYSLKLSRAAFERQPQVSDYFKTPLKKLEKDLQLSAKHQHSGRLQKSDAGLARSYEGVG